jgi:hypothetical protein
MLNTNPIAAAYLYTPQINAVNHISVWFFWLPNQPLEWQGLFVARDSM